jgi:hypothetical protein
MKMGSIALLWRYDATVEDAPPQHDVRRPDLALRAMGDSFLCVVDHPVTISMASGGSIP